MLEASNLTKTFGDNIAVNDLTLSIQPGEVYGLLGPNGAGKTTTINAFLGFVVPERGTAKVDGMDVLAEPLKTKQRLAYIPEQVMLYRNLSWSRKPCLLHVACPPNPVQ